MDRRVFIKAVCLGAVGLAGQFPLFASAQEIRQTIKRVSNSVGKSRRVRIEGEKAWHFTLTPKGRESEIAAEASGRQREELRDYSSSARGTVIYKLQFMLPNIDDPNGQLEAKFIFFQLKPRDKRGVGFNPYLTVEIPKNYRSQGPKVDFEFQDGKVREVRSGKPVSPNRWHALEVIVKWSAQRDGFADVKLDGRTIARHDGFTGPDIGDPLPNFGIYRSHLNNVDPSRLETINLYVRRYSVERIAN